jgi:4-amino-4-deoxy-L-arabinose transferase-like glycosyltransferase
VSEAAAEQLPVRPWGWVDILALAGLVFLSGALVCSSLGRRDLWNPDETRFSVVARTMHETGNYLVPHQGAALYQDKPPLVFWLMDLSAGVTGGFSDAAMKLPSAAASVLLAVAFYLLARLFFGELTSFLAVVALQTNVLFLVTAQFAMTDLPLMCLQAWAVYCFLRGEYTPGRRRGWYGAFYVLCALATLAKGPIGLLVPGAVLAVWVVASGRFHDPWRWGLHWGLGLYLVVVGAWLLPAALQAGKPYLDHLVGNLTVWRISGPEYHRYQPWFYYPWTFFPCFWPWSFYVPEALVRTFFHWWRDKEETPARRRLSEGLLLLVLWFVVVMAGWSVVGYKRVRYVMFAYLPASLAVGWLWAGLLTRRQRWSWATTGATVLLLVTLLALVGAALVLAIPGLGERALAHVPLDSSVPVQDLGAGVVGWRLDGLISAVSLAAVAGGLLWSLIGRRRWVWLWVVLVPVTLQANAAAWVFPLLNQYRSMRPTADICRELRAQHPQATILLYALTGTGTSWYAGDTTLLAPRTPKEVLALVDRRGETFLLTEASHLDELVAADPRLGQFPREEKKAGVRRILVLDIGSGEGPSERP